MEGAAKCMERRMRALADREHVDVLEYAYDEQERGADAIMCVKMFEMVAEKRRDLGPAVSAKEASAILCGDNNATIREFRKTSPDIFHFALDLEGGPCHLARLQQGGEAVAEQVKMFELVSERRRALGAAVSTDEAPAMLCGDDKADVRDFRKNFPGIFKNALDLEGGPRHLAMLKQLARIRLEVEQRQMSEAEANVHATRVILEKTMRAPTDKEKAELITPQSV